jgi:hypothetical protein
VIEGAFAWLHERYDEATGWLDRAEGLARTTDHPWAIFESHRYRARIERELGSRRASLREAHIAHALAAEQGWAPRARSLQSEFDFESAIPDASRSAAPPVPAGAPDARAKLHARYINVLSELSHATAKIFDELDTRDHTAHEHLAHLRDAEHEHRAECERREHRECDRAARDHRRDERPIAAADHLHVAVVQELADELDGRDHRRTTLRASGGRVLEEPALDTAEDLQQSKRSR